MKNKLLNNFIFRYLRESWIEITKVKWPTRKEIINNTIVVIISAAIATAFIGALDYGLSILIQLLIQKNG